MRALVAALLLLVAACSPETLALKAAGMAARQLTEAQDYAREVDDIREWVRRECLELLEEEVRELVASGDAAGARARLRANYPSLASILGAARGDEAPPGCS